MASSDHNLFVGSKVKYVGQRSKEVKCYNLGVSSITLHPSACLEKDLDGRCMLVILIFWRGQIMIIKVGETHYGNRLYIFR